MKFWRPGITGKLFIAILATCIVLLISMHWAVRISFERGFIDYIKRGNEQRLTMLGDALSDELGVQCGVLHFEDVELDLLAGELLELGANALSLGATAADDDARTSGVDVHTHAVTGTLDDDTGHARTLEILAHGLADGVIFENEVAVAFAGLVGIGEPLGTMVLSDAQAIAKWIDLLTHL